MSSRTQSSQSIFTNGTGSRNQGSREKTAQSRMHSSSSSSALIKKSESLASMRSLRGGKVTSFNPKINDNFPFLHTQKPSNTQLPVLALPRITSMDPTRAITAAEEAKKLEQDRLLLGRGRRNVIINPMDRRYKPSIHLTTASNQEREYIKEFLHISDALLRDIDDFENTKSTTIGNEDVMSTSFAQARSRQIQQQQAGRDDSTIMTDTGISFLSGGGDMNMSQITMGDMDSLQEMSRDNNNQQNLYNKEFFRGSGDDTVHGNTLNHYSYGSNEKRMGSSDPSAKLPALNLRQFGSSALDIASQQLSPTWAIKSFVGLTGGSLPAKSFERQQSMFDLDSLSVDGTVTTEMTMNTFQTKTRGGDNMKNRKSHSYRKNNSKSSQSMKLKRGSSVNTSFDGSVGNMSADEMKTELMNSLLNMQKHTVMVQENILHVQDLVSVIDPKAKETIASMAADRMKTALSNVIVKELRRGWDAWIIVFRAESRNAAAAHVDRFLKLRNVAFHVRRIVLQKLSNSFIIWKEAYLQFNEFLKKRVKYDAAKQIQRIARGMIARMGAEERREISKYRALYKGCITIQKIMRGKLVRWKYVAARLKRIQAVKIIVCQRVFRGHMARNRVRKIRLDILETECAIKMQCMIRKRAAYNIIREKRNKHKLVLAAIKIQSIFRMAIARKNVKKIAKEAHRNKMALRIQCVARGMIARINIERHKRKMEQERQFRLSSVVNIQRVYRGHRGRTYFRIKAVDYLRKKRTQNNAATKICNMVRKFLARCLVSELRKERFEGWVTAARKWQETKSEDGVTYFYLNSETGETLWEPPKDGYVKDDGLFVLASGETIVNPAFAGMGKEDDYNNNRVCSECSDRIAIRKCNDCGDKFCVPCFKDTHLTGTRKSHVWKPLGPIECSDCEMQLAERWCATCDEAFCDACWRVIHAKGKRRWHPFSEVDIGGRIDTRLYTIDGQQVETGYDSAYAQQQTEGQEASNWMPQAFDYDPNAAAYDPNAGATEEWTVYYDAENNPYWYNNYTYQSQYEDPYAGQYDQTADQAYYGYG